MGEEMTELLFLQLRQTAACGRVLQLLFAWDTTDPGGWKTTTCDFLLFKEEGEVTGQREGGKRASKIVLSSPHALFFPRRIVSLIYKFLRFN
jgi:hypothetical protein